MTYTVNTERVTQAVANMAVVMFANRISMAKNADYSINKQWKNNFYQFGDTMSVRLEVKSQIGDGQVALPQPISERVLPLTINHQYHRLFQYSARELTLDMPPQAQKEWAKRYLAPVLNNIASKMESDILTQALTQVYQYSGTVGTPLSSYSPIDDISQVLREKGVPDDDLKLHLNLADGGALRATYTNNFNTTINTDVNIKGFINHLGLFDIFENQACSRTFASNLAAGATCTLAADVANGATTLSLTGLSPTTVTIQAGDLLEFVSNPSLNYSSYEKTPRNFQAVVTAPVTAVAGAATVSIMCGPEGIQWNNSIQTDGLPNPDLNISRQPLTGDTIKFVGGTRKMNIAHARDALVIACPLIEPLDTPYTAVATHKDLPIGVRVSRIADIYGSVNLMRVDILVGSLWKGEYAAWGVS